MTKDGPIFKPLPIPYMTVRTYARDAGLSGDSFHTFVHLFAAIDDEWLRTQHKQSGDP